LISCRSILLNHLSILLFFLKKEKKQKKNFWKKLRLRLRFFSGFTWKRFR